MEWLLGIRPRSEFEGQSRQTTLWYRDRASCHKYNVGLKYWRAYRNILLFYMSGGGDCEISLLPELITLIISSSFSLSIHGRIAEAHQYGWRYQFRPLVRTGNDYVPGGLGVVHYDPDGDSNDGIDFDKTPVTLQKNGFIYDNIFIFEPFLDDDWMMRKWTNTKYDDELYYTHRWKVITNKMFYLFILLVWLLDAVVGNFAGTRAFPLYPVHNEHRLFHSSYNCVTSAECILSVPTQLVLNPLWFVRSFVWPAEYPMFPSLNDTLNYVDMPNPRGIDILLMSISMFIHFIWYLFILFVKTLCSFIPRVANATIT